MTFQEFAESAEAVRPHESVHCHVGNWRHVGDRTIRTREFTIYDCGFNAQFTGKTPAAALASYRATASPETATIESVGEIEETTNAAL